MNQKELINSMNSILNRAIKENRGLTDDEEKEVEEIETKIENLKRMEEVQARLLKNKVEADKIEKEEKTPVNNVLYAEPKANVQPKLFKNLVEQLKAVKDQAVSGIVDDRLLKINNAAAGMNESFGAEGGFAVQTDFAGLMMETAVTSGNILPLVDRYEISGGSNSVKWVDIDETSVATTVYGGVQVYWAAEAGTVTATKPKLIEKKLELEKLMGIAYSTYELDSDSAFISEYYTRSFTTAIQREIENTILNGNGAGKPLGILKGGSLVTVNKESGQANDTVIYENIVKLYNRSLNKNNSVWLIHPDVQEQLDFLEYPVGTGGVPVYLSSSSIGTLASLKGRPIIESDLCAALGDAGDLNFVDLSQYMLITKGGVQADTSMHVQFLTAENCFRFIFRANGMPKKNSALTLKNSANTRSSFVTLQAR